VPTDGAILNPSFEDGGANWIQSGSVIITSGPFVTDGNYAAKLSPRWYASASVFQWVRLTPGATYDLSADISTEGRVRATLGVKWDDYSDGPSQDITDSSSVHTVTVRFTVPEGVSQVGLYFRVSGSAYSNNWATVDNFKLSRVS